MKILFDTNVLDLLIDRKPFSTIAVQLFSKVEAQEIAGYLSATTVTTIHYLARKVIGPNKAKKEIKKLLTLFNVAAVNRPVLEAALTSKFRDFEDAVLHEAARQVEVQGIVTRNVKDFKQSKIHIYSPEELLQILAARN